MMSSYYETLGMMGKKRYKDKLGLLINDDPYSPSNAKKFHSDLSQ